MVIGIFGGSFNPIHIGHIAIARQALEQAGLDEVWFMVSPQNPFKKQTELMDDNVRLEMVKKALENEDGLVCSNYEFNLPKPSYTWNTLESLSRDFPEHKFVLVIGADNWAKFSCWYRSEDILSNYSILVYPRKDYPVDASALPEGVSFLDMELYDMSATMVRDMLRNEGVVPSFVPQEIVGTLKKELLEES